MEKGDACGRGGDGGVEGFEQKLIRNEREQHKHNIGGMDVFDSWAVISIDGFPDRSQICRCLKYPHSSMQRSFRKRILTMLHEFHLR